MSLPAVGDLVTVLFNGDASGTVRGALYGVAGRIVESDLLADGRDPCVLWTPTNPRETNYVVRAQFEGVYWMRGAGPEVEAALIAAFALHNCR